MHAGKRSAAQSGLPHRVQGWGRSDSGACRAGGRPELRGSLDSHRFVKWLTTAGLSEELAGTLADEHTRLIVPGDVATKADVEAVVTDLDTVRVEMATTADLRGKIAAGEARREQRPRNTIPEARVSLVKWMIAPMAVFSGIVIGGPDLPSVAGDRPTIT